MLQQIFQYRITYKLLGNRIWFYLLRLPCPVDVTVSPRGAGWSWWQQSKPTTTPAATQKIISILQPPVHPAHTLPHPSSPGGSVHLSAINWLLDEIVLVDRNGGSKNTSPFQYFSNVYLSYFCLVLPSLCSTSTSAHYTRSRGSLPAAVEFNISKCFQQT